MHFLIHNFHGVTLRKYKSNTRLKTERHRLRKTIKYTSRAQNNDMSNDSGDYPKRTKPGRFAWVKRLIQPKGNTSAKESVRRHPPRSQKRLSTSSSYHLKARDSHSDHGDLEAQDEDTQQQEHTNGNPGVNFEIDSRKVSSKSPSITEGSMINRSDNVSTLPVISMSTMSARSSTFSEGSLQSTSNTVVSEHPTLFTNASTMGIPPASIMDRRDRVNRQLSMNSHLYATNNSSNHTFNTTMSPRSDYHNLEPNDNNSMVS